MRQSGEERKSEDCDEKVTLAHMLDGPGENIPQVNILKNNRHFILVLPVLYRF